jgi:hypothetical protein
VEAELSGGAVAGPGVGVQAVKASRLSAKNRARVFFNTRVPPSGLPKMMLRSEKFHPLSEELGRGITIA